MLREAVFTVSIVPDVFFTNGGKLKDIVSKSRSSIAPNSRRILSDSGNDFT